MVKKSKQKINFKSTFVLRRLKLSTIALLLFTFFILTKCANQLPPSGGEPDRIPPEVINIYPPDGTINFDDDYIEIEFSEYVDKRSFREAIFISPFVEGTPEYSWTGTSVEIYFPEGLKKDLTYTITVGTDVVDINNKNRMAQAYTFTFSTGEKIDRKMISGKVFGKDRVGVYLFAYKQDNDVDTLLFRKPDYISQTGTNGNFKLQGLAGGDYRVFAVKDKYRDLVYQQEQDEIGIPFSDIHLSDADSVFVGLNFLLFDADTTKPRLISGIMTDVNHILVTFSKEVDTSSIKSDFFSVIDSTGNKTFNINYAFKGKTKPEEIVLALNDDINMSDQYYLFADSIIDKKGNVTLNDFTTLTVSDRPDTSSINITSTVPLKNGTVDFQNAEIKILFDDAIVNNNIQNAITFSDTLNNKIQFNVLKKDDATLIFNPLQSLKPDKDYMIKLDLNKFPDAAGNKRDSVFILKFTTISGLDFTGLSGKFIDTTSHPYPVLILESTDKNEQKYIKRVSSGTFDFTRVLPGKYLLWSFIDENNNGEYDYGFPFPLKYSEKFSFYPDTLNLRPRWEVTDLNFYFK